MAGRTGLELTFQSYLRLYYTNSRTISKDTPISSTVVLFISTIGEVHAIPDAV